MVELLRLKKLASKIFKKLKKLWVRFLKGWFDNVIIAISLIL